MPGFHDYLTNLREAMIVARDFGDREIIIDPDASDAAELHLQYAFGDEQHEPAIAWAGSAAAIALSRPFAVSIGPGMGDQDPDVVNYCAAMRSLSIRPIGRDAATCLPCKLLDECSTWTPTDGNLCLRHYTTLVVRRFIANPAPIKAAYAKCGDDFSAWLSTFAEHLAITLETARSKNVTIVRKQALER